MTDHGPLGDIRSNVYKRDNVVHIPLESALCKEVRQKSTIRKINLLRGKQERRLSAIYDLDCTAFVRRFRDDYTSTEEYTRIINNEATTDEQRIFVRKVLDKVMIAEDTFCGDYVSVYHGAESVNKFLADVTTMLFFMKNGEDLDENILLMRLNLEQPQKGSAYDFYENIGSKMDDQRPEYMDHAISVNLNLLGNSHNSGESTYHYWLKGSSVASMNPSVILGKIFAKLDIHPDIRDKYITRLVAHFHYYYTKTSGILYQIFLRRDVVDDVLFLAVEYGHPIPVSAQGATDAFANPDTRQMQKLEEDLKRVKGVRASAECPDGVPAVHAQHFPVNLYKLNTSIKNVKYKSRTFTHMRAMDYLQGRLVVSATTTFRDPNQVFVITYGNTDEDLSTAKLDLYVILTDLSIENKIYHDG